MTPGPDIILKTPERGDLVKTSTINSGNTFGATLWTDGKMEAPMLPDEPMFLCNPQTGESFWIDDCEEIGEAPGIWSEPREVIHEDRVLSSEEIDAIPYAAEAQEDQYLELLKQENLMQVRERYARMRVWWLDNDRARQSGSSNRPAHFRDNLESLLPLLVLNIDEDRLMAAEILRELGEHQGATQMLDFTFKEEYSLALRTIQNLNEEAETRVAKIPTS